MSELLHVGFWWLVICVPLALGVAWLIGKGQK